MLDNITINEHSSIRIADKIIAYIDPFRLKEERHDADLILFTHPHFDHFSPEDFRKAAKPETIFVCPLSMRADALAAGIEAKPRQKRFLFPSGKIACKYVRKLL